MNPEERLARIVAGLEALGVSCLVMGGHAVPVSPASPLHLTLIEAVRRQYKLAAQAADRADKQAIRAAQGTQAPRP